MKVNYLQKSGLLACLAVMTLPAWAAAAPPEETSQAETQRAACAAKCRDDYQANASALEACLRDCGAVEPANPGLANSAQHEATHTVQQAAGVNRSTVKSSKSNSSERGVTAPVAPPPIPAAASNLNMSKSNINRTTGGESETPTEADSADTEDE